MASARVPAEYIGLARQFYKDIDRTSDPHNIQHLLNPYKKRLAKKATLRPEHFIELNKAWKSVRPETHRLLYEGNFVKGHSSFIEVFLSVGQWNHPEWGEEWESTIFINNVILTTKPRCFNILPLAVVSLHALARRYERNSDHDHAAIMHDFQLLIANINNESRHFPAKDGVWIGDRRDKVWDQNNELMEGIVSIRTYYSNDMVIDQ